MMFSANYALPILAHCVSFLAFLFTNQYRNPEKNLVDARQKAGAL